MSEKEHQLLYDTLSAYIDGELEAPDEVERLIATDAGAARLYAELSRLSARLKALQPPEVHPAFATRVMAHVREPDTSNTSSPLWRRVLISALGSACALAVMAVAVWPFWPDKGITAPVQTDPVVAEVLRLRNQPEQVLAEKFGPLLADPESSGQWPGAPDADSGMALVADPALSDDYATVTGMVASLLDPEPIDADEGDVFAELDSLSESQADALRGMLSDYVKGGANLL